MVNGNEYTCLVIRAGKTKLQANLGRRRVTEALGRCVGIIIRIDRVIEPSLTDILSVDLGSRSR